MKEEANLKQEIIKVRNKVEPIIFDTLKKNVSLPFEKMVLHPLMSGGKRLRPALAVWTCCLLGGKEKDVLGIAASLEIFHNYTLVIDDIIDHGLLRRNKPTAIKQFGPSLSNLISMDLAVAIFEANKDERISELLIKTMKSLTEGQILDVLFERAGRNDEPYLKQKRLKSISQNKYFEMISKKTAFLIAACCQAGGLVAHASRKELSLLKDFGLNLGLAFQIQDDILDIFGQEKNLGKKIGKDIEERKGGNLVLLFAQKENEKITQILKQKLISQKQIEKAISLISQTKARERAEGLRNNYLKKALLALKGLPQNKYNQLLEETAYFVTQREK